MSFIKLFFSLLILIKKSIEYYNLKYGNIILDYYDESDCLGNYSSRVRYPIEDNEELKVLNSEGFVNSYSYDFDFFSSSIIYTDGNGEEDEEEDVYKRSFICNGLCYKRQNNSDILVDPDTILAPDYNEESQDKLYYSCIYNNIIKTATINITMYNNDKKCKIEEKRLNFTGNESCWNVNESFSYRPLYFEDENKKLYYHSYNTEDCTSKYIEYFVINKDYFKCNNECNLLNDNITYYKCNFQPNSKNIIKLNIYLLFLFIIFIFLIL